MVKIWYKSIQPNFPPGVLATDARYLQQVYSLSDGTVRGPWNQGEIKGVGKEFEYVEYPIAYVQETEGLTALPDNKSKELKSTEKLNQEMSKAKSEEVSKAEPDGVTQWSTYAVEQN